MKWGARPPCQKSGLAAKKNWVGRGSPLVPPPISKRLCTAEIYYFVNDMLWTNSDKLKNIGPDLLNPTLDQEQEMCHVFVLRDSYS